MFLQILAYKNDCKAKCNEKMESIKHKVDVKNAARLAKKPYLIEGRSKNEKVIE